MYNQSWRDTPLTRNCVPSLDDIRQKVKEIDSTAFICTCLRTLFWGHLFTLFWDTFSFLNDIRKKVKSIEQPISAHFPTWSFLSARPYKESLQKFERSLNPCFEQLSKKLDALQWPKVSWKVDSSLQKKTRRCTTVQNSVVQVCIVWNSVQKVI